MFELHKTDVLALIGCGLTLIAIKTYLVYHRLAKSVDYLPGTITLLSGTALAKLLPTIPGIVRRGDWPWVLKHTGTWPLEA